jgi:hypothetical protein
MMSIQAHGVLKALRAVGYKAFSMSPGSAFVICQVGSEGSSERERADEIFRFVVEPIVKEFDLTPTRSDRDPTPGQITAQIIRSLTAARVVIADLTGRNPNVYYELGVAHSFAIPVVILVDSVESLSFDTSQERVIELGAQERLAIADAERAKGKLRESLKVVMANDYEPSSLVSEAAGSRSLQDLAPDNPMATELAHVREGVELLLRRTPAEKEGQYRRDSQALYRIIRNLAAEGRVSFETLDEADVDLDQLAMSDELRTSLEAVIPVRSPQAQPDDIPF